MGAKSLAARGRLGEISRRHSNQPDLIQDARRELAVAKIEDYVQRVVNDAPPLTAEQRLRLGALLLANTVPGGSDAA